MFYLCINKLKKQTDLKGQHSLHLYVMDPATFLASSSVLGT